MKKSTKLLFLLLIIYYTCSVFFICAFHPFQEISNTSKINLSANGDSWITQTNGSLRMCIDTYDNIYVLNLAWVPPNDEFGITKYNDSGDVLWRIDLPNFKQNRPSIYSIASMENLFVIGFNESEEIILTKINPSGNILWNTRIADYSYRTRIFDLCLDSEENVFIFGQLEDPILNHNFICEYNNSGDLQWFQEIEGYFDYDQVASMKIDSVGNIITTDWSHIRCYNQTCVEKWKIPKQLTQRSRVAVNSNDEIIAVHGKTAEHPEIIKINKTGFVLWNKTLSQNTPNLLEPSDYGIPVPFFEAEPSLMIGLNPLDELYIAGTIKIPNEKNARDLIVVNVSESGNYKGYLTWGSSSHEGLEGLDFDSAGNMYVLSRQYLVKNPQHNGKTLIFTDLIISYLIMLLSSSFVCAISLFLILKNRIPRS